MGTQLGHGWGSGTEVKPFQRPELARYMTSGERLSYPGRRRDRTGMEIVESTVESRVERGEQRKREKEKKRRTEIEGKTAWPVRVTFYCGLAVRYDRRRFGLFYRK